MTGKINCMKLIICTALSMVLAGQILDPRRDPVKEMQKAAQKEAAEKNYKDLKQSATELAELSKQVSAEINEGGQHVVSARLFERLEKIEKLTRHIRDKAR